MIISQEIESLRNELDRLIDRLELLDMEVHDRRQENGTSPEEMMSLIRDELQKQKVMRKTIAEATGCTPAAVSRYFKGSRKAPVSFILGALDYLGYKVEVLPMVLPFEPEGE